MPAKYASIKVRDNFSNRIADMDACKKMPVAWEKIQNKEKFEDDYTKTKTQLEAVTPPDTSGTERDNLKRRLTQLQEALVNGNSVVPPMPSHEQMWKSPAGSVGQHISWESYWKNHTLDANGKAIAIDKKVGQRGAVWEMKDALRTFNKEREGEDYE